METPRYTEPEDQFLRDLFSKIPIEKAPENFTSGILQQVYSGVEPIQESPEIRKQLLLGYGSLLVAIIIVGLMIFAQLPFLNINLSTDFIHLKDLLNASMSILDGINRISSFLKQSSTVIIIFSAIGLLLLIERLIRKEFIHNRSFIF